MLWIAETRGYRPIRVSQPMYNLIARRLEDEFLPACQALGISTVVYNPLAGGLLAGKHSAAAPLAGSRFDGNRAYLDRYWSQANHEAVSRLAAAAAGAGRSLVSVSLNWLLHHTLIDCVILGASRPEQLEQNLRALEDGPLPSDVLAVCDEVWKLLRGPSPKYNR
jgi:aryl-alcohol dehydrogenase-like predicted oxidoreductase